MRACVRACVLETGCSSQHSEIPDSVLDHVVGETGASCMKGHVVTEVCYENKAHIWRYHRR